MALINVNFKELKVLIVDDSRTARLIVKEVLNAISVTQVEMAEDGADAMAKLKTFPADIVLCDLHMAPLDGIEFMRLLRGAEDSPNPYLPVLMLTSDATERQLKNAFGAGVNDFMSKPISVGALRRKLHALYSSPLVFLRDGRYLKPLRAGDPTAPRRGPPENPHQARRPKARSSIMPNPTWRRSPTPTWGSRARKPQKGDILL